MFTKSKSEKEETYSRIHVVDKLFYFTCTELIMKLHFELNFFPILLFHFFCFFASHIYVSEIFNDFPEFITQLV